MRTISQASIAHAQNARQGRPPHRPMNANKLSRDSQAIRLEIEQGNGSSSASSWKIFTCTSSGRLIERIGDVRPKTPHRPQPKRPSFDPTYDFGSAIAIDRDRSPLARSSKVARSAVATAMPASSCRATPIFNARSRSSRRTIGFATVKNTSAIASRLADCRKSRKRAQLGARPRWPARVCRSIASDVARRLGFESVAANSLDCFERPRFRARIRRSHWR